MTYPQDPYGGQPGYPQQPPGYGYAVPPMPAAGTAHGGPPTPQECSDASMAHYLGIIGIIGPLIYMAVAGNKSPFVRANAVSSLNFQITFIIYYLGSVIAGVALGVGLGLLIGIAAILVVFLVLLAALGLLIWDIVNCVQAGGAAKRGQVHQYRGSFKLVK